MDAIGQPDRQGRAAGEPDVGHGSPEADSGSGRRAPHGPTTTASLVLLPILPLAGTAGTLVMNRRVRSCSTSERKIVGAPHYAAAKAAWEAP